MYYSFSAEQSADYLLQYVPGRALIK